MKAIFSVILLAGAAVLYGQAASRVVIREVRGSVELKEPGADRWVPARAGQTIARSAEISTGFRSTAVLDVGNSVVTVQALTRLTVDEVLAAAGDERVTIDLRVGRVRADVKPPAGGKTAFEVRSPTATASVRGTVFDFDGTRLTVDEGRVHVSGGDSGTYVGAGHDARIAAENGRTISGLERLMEDLVPAAPAGMADGFNTPDTGSGSPAPLAPAAAPAQGSMKVGFEWQ
ncbi:MAG: FecR domain-containing protein [Treponema sp.]|jgi:hypothetical protein|nr:FecR domain-containing protein [Treponema sp.]